MKKKLLVLVAMIMTLATLATLVNFASAADADATAKLYAYTADVTLDGAIAMKGASVANNAAQNADKASTIAADHAIEFVMENAIDDNVTVGASWNLDDKMLYLAIEADLLVSVDVVVGGAEGTLEADGDEVDGIVGSEAAWNDDGTVVEIALPIEEMQLKYVDGFAVADIALTVDRGSKVEFEGQVVLTGFEPIVAMNAAQDYRAMRIAVADVKNTPKSGAGTFYRYWQLDTETGFDYTKPFTMHAPEGKHSSTRSSFWLFGYDPMYFDLDASAYSLKTSLTFNDMPEVDKAVLSSVNINAASYDTNPHFVIYMSNLRVDAQTKMISAGIYNTADGLQMVFHPAFGVNTVIDLGVEDGDTFELMLVSHIDADNAHPVDVYVNGALVKTVKGMQVTGTSISEAGFGFNIMTNCTNANAYSIDVAYATSNVQYADFDVDAVLALSAGEKVTTPETTTTEETTTEETTTAETTTEETTTADTTAADTTAADTTAADTTAADTTAADTTDAAKGGCGSSLVGYGITMVLGSAVMAVIATSKKKED